MSDKRDEARANGVAHTPAPTCGVCRPTDVCICTPAPADTKAMSVDDAEIAILELAQKWIGLPPELLADTRAFDFASLRTILEAVRRGGPKHKCRGYEDAGGCDADAEYHYCKTCWGDAL